MFTSFFAVSVLLNVIVSLFRLVSSVFSAVELFFWFWVKFKPGFSLFMCFKKCLVVQKCSTGFSGLWPG